MAYQKLQVSDGLKVITSDDVNIPDPSTVVILDKATGSTVGVANFALVLGVATLTDVGTKFTEAGIQPGAIVYNTTAGAGGIGVAYYVEKVVSDTVLTLSGATAGGATDSYSIYNSSTIGCILYVGGTGEVKAQLAAHKGNTTTAAEPANQTLTFKNLPNASFLPVQVVRVDDDSTATDIIALW
tara:strand:- start:467 stop:1018 length:552 start_codon:yes stop_codon:yes gene_type:complete